MDKIVGIKRKAQRFAQSGDLTKAVAEYDKLVESGDMDPYDFVYLGDLLVRISRLDDAVLRYRDAISAYERVNLYKNAVAVGKKILRIRPEAFDIHRLLGQLYFLEGLYTDSLFYYMQFLSAAPPESESASIEEVGVRLLGMPLPNPDLALSVVGSMAAANCAHAAARPLHALAAGFERRGLGDQAAALKRRALELDPKLADELAAAENASASTDLEAEHFAPPLAFTGHDPAGGHARGGAGYAPGGDDGGGRDSFVEGNSLAERHSGPNAPAGGSSAAAPDDFGMIDLGDDSFAGAGEGSGAHAVPGDGALSGAGSGAETGCLAGIGSGAETGSLAAIGSGTGAAAASADGETAGSAADIAGLLAHDRDIPADDYRALIGRGEEHLSNGDTARGLRVLLAAGRIAFAAGESRIAEKVYGDIVKLDPNHLEGLQGLTEIAHINGERAKIVRHGCELGDVLLARERYAEAKLEFERVLQFDPKNEKAKARVRRLNSIEGLEQVTARPLAPVASEVRGATVTVRQEPVSGRTQSILDLSEIMNEFQSAVASQVPADDAQSHYDLGMTYHEMGMIEPAVAEFEIAAASPLHTGRALEMITRCLISAGRAEDALTAIEERAGQPGAEEAGCQANLFACRGLALESLGRTSEALHAMERAIALDPLLEIAREGIERMGGEGRLAA